MTPTYDQMGDWLEEIAQAFPVAERVKQNNTPPQNGAIHPPPWPGR